MSNDHAPELLDRRHVAVAGWSRRAVFMDTPVTLLLWLDSPLRLWGALRAAVLPQHRVPTAQGQTVDTEGQSDFVRGRVAGMPLQARRRAPLADQGNGNARLLEISMSYPLRVLIAIDQLAATVFFGTEPDETISAMAYRRNWTALQAFINFIFRDPDHCRDSYYSEKNGTQNHPEYRS